MYWSFSLKKGILFQRSVKNYIVLIVECDRSSPIKNFTDKLNLHELQVNDISATFTAESTNEIYTIQVNNALNRCQG